MEDGTMAEKVEGIFRPNDSLDDTLRDAMRADGCGLFERLIVSMRVRRLSDEGRAALEKELGKMVSASVEAGTLKLPPKAAVVGGVLVGNWQDLFQWFLDNLPAILEAIMSIIAMFS
jgi:hypothetical protein